MQTLKHNGYHGSIEYSKKDNCYYGKVLGLNNKTYITYEGNTLEALAKDFKIAIDDYLKMCEARGWTPETPNSDI